LDRCFWCELVDILIKLEQFVANQVSIKRMGSLKNSISGIINESLPLVVKIERRRSFVWSFGKASLDTEHGEWGRVPFVFPFLIPLMRVN
jgi:hypothetical protein